MANPPHPESVEAMAARLRLIRIGYGKAQGFAGEMSQAELCRLTGIGRAAWNNAETGDGRIGIDNAMKLARKTGAGLNYIFRGDEADLAHALGVQIQKLVQIKPKRA